MTGVTLLIQLVYMGTTKKRINISVSSDVEKAIESLAKRDEVPVATKAAQLVRNALEIEEDFALAKLADERLRTEKEWFTHEEVWG